MQRSSKRKILRDLRNKRREAYEKVVKQYYRAIYCFMVYFTNDADLAEDLTQDTFTLAWANISGLKNSTSIKTWLYKIAYNVFIDSLRKNKRGSDFFFKLKQTATNSKVGSNPLQRLIDKEHLVLLLQGMKELKQSDYLVIVLHYIQGLSFREMSEVMNEPSGTIKWRTNKAIKKLRAFLKVRVQL